MSLSEVIDRILSRQQRNAHHSQRNMYYCCLVLRLWNTRVFSVQTKQVCDTCFAQRETRALVFSCCCCLAGVLDVLTPFGSVQEAKTTVQERTQFSPKRKT